jgi:sn-glycerol 3-phosphate transport system permease protein
MSRGGFRSRLRKDRLFGAALLVPAMACFTVFVFYPLGRTAWLSLNASDLFGRPAGFVGLSNFRALFASSDFGQTMRTTALFAAEVVAGKLVFGLAIAVPLARKLRGIKVFRVLLTSPLAASVATASVAFVAILTPGVGILNIVIKQFGGQPVPWLTSSTWALPSVGVATVWGELGFTVLLLVAAVMSIDEQVIEAAQIDGVGALRMFRSVTLPLITPTLFFIVVTSTISALRTFGQIHILTQGGPAGATTTLVYDIYTTAFGPGNANVGMASAMGLVLFAVILALSGIQVGMLERRVNYA